MASLKFISNVITNQQFLQRKIQQDATVYQNFIIPYFKWSSKCFGRHTAHHQEPKTAQVASGFAYVEGRRTCSCWTLLGSVPDNVQQLHVRQPTTYVIPEAASAVLGSWWWAVCRPKHFELHLKKGIIKFWYTVASCWIFHCKNCTMTHGSTNIKFTNQLLLVVNYQHRKNVCGVNDANSQFRQWTAKERSLI